MISARAAKRPRCSSPDSSGSASEGRHVRDGGDPVQAAAGGAALAQLTDMGFSRDSASAALVASGGDVLAAAETLSEPAESGGLEARLDKGGATDEAALAQLVAMGFQEKAAAAALAASGGDPSLASEMLTRKNRLTQDGPAARPARQPKPSCPPNPQPSAQRVSSRQRLTPLAALSKETKAVVVRSLGGPSGARASAAEQTIKRGRVALRRNYWAGDADDDRLAQLSPAYGKLKPYQQAGVRWLLGLAEFGVGGILADEMGLGKTAQLIVFLDLLSQLESGGAPDGSAPPPARPSLVIVPASILETWESEVMKWCPHFRPFRYHAQSQAQRFQLGDKYFQDYDGSCRVVLTTAAIMHNPTDRKEFFKQIQFECLVCDEAHSMKNAEASRFRDVRGLHVNRRVLLTGTPVQNSLRELGNLITLLLSVPNEHGKVDFKAAIEELHEVAETGSLRTLQVRVAPLILRRLKRDVMADMPTKDSQAVRCVLRPAQKAMYDAECEMAKTKAKGLAAGAKNAARARREYVRSLFHRLRRTCSHPLLAQSRFEEADYERLAELMRQVRPDYRKVSLQRVLSELRSWSDFDVVQAVRQYDLAERLGAGPERARWQVTRADLVEGSGKIAELLQLLHAQREVGRKTLVFSQFTQFLDLIGEALAASGYVYARLDGGTKIDSRPEVVRSFQTEGSGVDVFLLSTKAGGTGLNLIAADLVVLMDLSFNPQDNRQAEDRAHRLGQTRPVRVRYLVSAGTVEEAVLDAGLQKMLLDYEFGGQRVTLKGARNPEAPAPQAPPSAEGGGVAEEGEEEEEEGASNKDREEEVLARLERELIS